LKYFDTPPLFNVPVGVTLLEFRKVLWRQKTRMIGLLDSEEVIMV